MLSVIDKKGKVVGHPSPDDLESLLEAFSMPGATSEARQQGAAVVRKYQQQHCWFRCSCLGDAGPAPVLVPVAEAYIRRDANYPDHADGCLFEMDSRDRERYAKSLRVEEPSAGFRLARAIARPGAAPIQDEEGEGGDASGAEAADEQDRQRGPCKARERSKLSQLLFKLLSDTRLHRIGSGPRGYDAQRDALHVASRRISLGGDLCLSGVLDLDPGNLAELAARLGQRPRWPKGRRPHGVLVFIAQRIECDVLVATSGVRLTVEGPIGVFGPGRGGTRMGPFVVAVLVASPDGRAPFVPLEAYAHPCWSSADALPVDSSHERRCLDILVGFQSWMATQGCTVEVTKPLYDRSLYYCVREEADMMVKPDFEGRIRAADGQFVRSFVVEVIGYDHAAYRRTKDRLRTIFRNKRMQLIEHAAHDGVALAEGDRSFKRDLKRLGDQAIERARIRVRQQAEAVASRHAPVVQASQAHLPAASTLRALEPQERGELADTRARPAAPTSWADGVAGEMRQQPSRRPGTFLRRIGRALRGMR